MCDFCELSVWRDQMIYIDDTVMILYPRKPLIFGHVLVLPARHVEFFHELEDREIVAMKNSVTRLVIAFEKSLDLKGYNIFTNNGTQVGQSVPHIHWHIFLRSLDEIHSPYDILNGKYPRENLDFLSDEWKARKTKLTLLFLK